MCLDAHLQKKREGEQGEEGGERGEGGERRDGRTERVRMEAQDIICGLTTSIKQTCARHEPAAQRLPQKKVKQA